MKCFSRDDFSLKGVFAVVATLVLFPGIALSEPILADAVPAQEFEEKIPVEEVAPMAESCGWNQRISAGVPLYFFDAEDDEVGAGGYLDVWHCDRPLNFRIGVEGTHMDLGQTTAAPLAEFPGKTVEATFIRVPISVEYYREFGEGFYLATGPGVSIVNTANDHSETGAGFHIGARLGYEFNDHWGVAVEGGYLWLDLDGAGAGDINYDTAYVTPTFSYKF